MVCLILQGYFKPSATSFDAIVHRCAIMRSTRWSTLLNLALPAGQGQRLMRFERFVSASR